MKKKVLAVILTAVCTMGLMAGCGNSNVGNTKTQKNASSEEDGYKIGISQFAEHGSLDNCTDQILFCGYETVCDRACCTGIGLRVLIINRQIFSFLNPFFF